MPGEGGAAAVPARTGAFVLMATILASALGFIDGSVVNIALPAIQASLDTSFQAVQWVANAYGLTLSAFILVAGGLGDRFGRRRVFLIGIAVFTAASLACAIAPTAALLITARGAQGVGAALLIPQSLAIITATFPRQGRGRAIGTWAAASSITTALGPPLGGLLVDALSWRAVFWINLPLAIAAVWLTLAAVPESRDESAAGALDYAGAVVAALSFGALAYGLSAYADETTAGLLASGLVAAGVAGLGLFVWIESRAANPVMPLDLFRSPVFAGTNIMTVFLYGCLSAVLFLIPFEFIARRGLTAGEAGLAMVPMGLVIGILSRTTGSLSDRIGPRRFLIVGSAIVTLACVLLALRLDNFWLGGLLPVILVALGMGIVVSPLTTAVMNAADESRSGAASGINNAAARVAGLLAVAVFGAIASLIYHAAAGPAGGRFGVLPPVGDPARPALEAAFGTAYGSAMWLAAGWAAAAVLTVVLMIRDRPAEAAGKA